MIPLSKLTLQFVLFGLLGLLAEVVFTGVLDTVKNKRFSLEGRTHLWMFPIYGLIALVYPPLHDAVAGYVWYVRGIVYMLALFLVEYISGWLLLKVTGDYVWRYTSRFNLHGLIQLPHAPVWFFTGLGVERLYPYVVKISRILVTS